MPRPLEIFLDLAVTFGGRVAPRVLEREQPAVRNLVTPEQDIQAMKTHLATALGFAALTASFALAFSPEASSSPEPLIGQTYEVAMDGSSFSFEGDVNPAGFPANGTPFVISGYIYNDGIFDTHGDLSGVLADGSPEFPDQVIGSWICRGWHLQDGDAATGPVVATTQIFDFNENAPDGTHTIITDGIELADFEVPFLRAVTGATGRLRDLDDQSVSCEQTYVGGNVNISGGFNTEFTFIR